MSGTERRDFGTTPDETPQAVTLTVHPLTEAEQARLDCILSVERVDNGWLLRQGPRVEVVEELEDYTDDTDARTTRRLLYLVLDMLGRAGSKHDPYRVRVVVMDQQKDEPVERCGRRV